MDREKVIKALSICFPETQDDSKLECSDCPYGDVCNTNDIVGVTLPLIWDIRVLLKEQEAARPVMVNTNYEQHWNCGNCSAVISVNDKYCHECGKPVEWE